MDKIVYKKNNNRIFQGFCFFLVRLIVGCGVFQDELFETKSTVTIQIDSTWNLNNLHSKWRIR